MSINRIREKMNIYLNKKKDKFIQGSLFFLGDKSLSHRSLIISALDKKKINIENILFSLDIISTKNIFLNLGIKIKIKKGKIKIKGNKYIKLKKTLFNINMSTSGTTLRLLSGLLIGQKFSTRIVMAKQLYVRPKNRIFDTLTKIGCSFQKRKCYVNLFIRKKIKFFFFYSNISSAQIKSSILFSSFFLKKIVYQETLETRDHTERLFIKFGYYFKYLRNKNILYSKREKNKIKKIYIFGDISSVSFFLAIQLILYKNIILKNILLNSKRMGLIDVLRKMGGRILLKKIRYYQGEMVGDIILLKSRLIGVNIPSFYTSYMIDEIPLLAVICTQSIGVTQVHGAFELKTKESNRIKRIVIEIRKIGGNIKSIFDGFKVKGKTKLFRINMKTCFDHRIAMAMIVASIISSYQSNLYTIRSCEDSFPGFINLTKLLGVNLVKCLKK